MISILAAIIVLGLLIIVHELGHFSIAKLTGIGVEKFSIGFGPAVFKKTVGETEYRISAFPLGGYVKMVGENPDEEPDENIDKEKSFIHKPVWTRLAVVSAGPLFNLLLAILIFTAVFTAGVPVLLPVVGGVEEGFPAVLAGIQAGDRISSIDGVPISEWEEMTLIIHDNPGKTLLIGVVRAGEEISFRVTPRETAVPNIFGEETTVGLIGISPANETIIKRYNPLTATGMAFQRTWDITRLTFVAVVKIFQRVIPADSIGGPIMIVQMAGDQARMGLMNLILFIAFLSISLGIFNLLPIPILDGGHIFFFLIEAVRRKPISIRNREIVQQIGLVLLITIFLYVSYNDIMRWISKIFAE